MKLRSILVCAIIALGLTQSGYAKIEDRNIKLLVLIIASDQDPVYTELQKVWKSYMHYDSDHVEAYFIKGDPNLTSIAEIKGDVIYSKTPEGWITDVLTPTGLVPASAGVLNKTLLSLEAMAPRFKEFDYVLRTNLSTFYNFPKMLEFLKKLPVSNCYAGSPCDFFASGTGIIMSPDVAQMLVDSKAELFDNKSVEDDVVIGHFFRKKGVPVIHHDRLDILSLADWQKVKNTIPSNIFQFRVKGEATRRLHDDTYIHRELLKMYEHNQLLFALYNNACTTPSDVNEHVAVLKDLAKQCQTVLEIGIRSMVTSWGIYQGLAESGAGDRCYIGIDLDEPPVEAFNLAKKLTRAHGIEYKFLQGNDMILEPVEADMLFIDSLHTYCHLTYELEKFSPKTKKFIAMHDTSEPWGYIVDYQQYHGDYSEYPAEYSRTRVGLWAAVEDFLERHPEWELHERRLNCHGLTILRRKA